MLEKNSIDQSTKTQHILIQHMLRFDAGLQWVFQQGMLLKIRFRFCQDE